MPGPSLPRRLAYAAVLLAVALGLVEVALSAAWPLLDRRDPLPVPREALAGSVVCVGDSVTFGTGLRPEEAWPARLQGILDSGGGRVEVQNAGRPGRRAAELDIVTAGELGERGRFARSLVVLVLLGHNDVIDWGVAPIRPGDVAPTAETYTPRLLRIVRWGVASLTERLPDVKDDPGFATMYREKLAALAKHLPGDRVYVLTYPLPGPAGLDAPSAVREVVARTRAAQGPANERTRGIAAELGLPLLDLDREVSRPEVWSAAWYQDGIHLTATGSEAVARVVAARLLADGALDGSPGR